MDLKKRLDKLESRVGSLGREKLVVIKAKNDQEYEQKKAEYLIDHPEPEMFIHLVDFSELFEAYDRMVESGTE